MKLTNENTLDLEAIIDHSVHECHVCNQRLTEIFIHHRQVNCKHKWKFLTPTTKGCTKCMLTKEHKK